MRLLEVQALLKWKSTVDTCSTMELEIDLELPLLYWKGTLQHSLQLPYRIVYIQRPITWIHFLAQLDSFSHKGVGVLFQLTLI